MQNNVSHNITRWPTKILGMDHRIFKFLRLVLDIVRSSISQKKVRRLSEKRVKNLQIIHPTKNISLQIWWPKTALQILSLCLNIRHFETKFCPLFQYYFQNISCINYFLIDISLFIVHHKYYKFMRYYFSPMRIEET